jgi:hypothetical protein
MNGPRCQCVNPPRQQFCGDCLHLSTDSAPSVAPVAGESPHNRKTAKALGLTIPQSVLLRADEVLQ